MTNNDQDRVPKEPGEGRASGDDAGRAAPSKAPTDCAVEARLTVAPSWSPLLDALGDGVLLFDAEGRLGGANRAALELLDLPPTTLSERRCCELFGEGRAPGAGCLLERVRATMRRHVAAVAYQERQLELACDPVVDGGGRLQGALCVLRDVTERTRVQESVLHEAALDTTLSELAAELLAAGSVERVEARVLEAARSLTDAQASAVGVVDVAASVLVARVLGPDASLRGLAPGRHPLAQLPGWCSDVIEHGQPLLRNHPGEEGAPSDAASSPANRPQRLLAVPAVSAGVVIALVAVANAPRDFTRRDATRIERLGVLFGLAIQRMHAARALQESEIRYRTLVDNQGEGIGIVDPNETFVFANPAGERQFGVGAGGLVGRNLREFTDPNAFSRVQDQTEARKAGHRSTYEVDIIRADGARRTLLVTATPRYDADATFVGTFGIFRDVTERKAAEASVRIAEARSRALYEMGQREFATETELVECALEEAVRLTGSEAGYFHFVQPSTGGVELFAWTGIKGEPAELESMRRAPLADPSLWADCLRNRLPVVQNELAPKDGLRERPADPSVVRSHLGLPVLDREHVVAVTGVANKRQPYDETDVTQLRLFMDGVWKLVARRRAEQEHQALQQQLQVAQKMEAVGQLAGGVAHDFNNLLAAINGYADVLLEDLPDGSPLREDVEQIRRAGDRGAALVRQLLAFGRRQVVMPAAVSLNSVVEGMAGLLRRLIGEDITLVTRLDPAAGHVFADHGQVEQILMNLAANGRDAMPLGGTLTIETSNLEVREGEAGRHVGLKPGPHVLLAISDTGCGMDADTRSRIFEPFFTTKPAGKGTGLGLSTVYGIVQMSGGSVVAQSELGRGSSFEIVLPRCEPRRPSWRALQQAERPRGGAETVLVAEDEDAVRMLAYRILTAVGYRVLTAASGAEALALASDEQGPIHLLVADVVMPGMSGADLARQLVTSRPGVRVLLTSGYTGDAIVHHGVLERGVSFLPKPFAATELVARVRALLDEDEQPET